MVLPSVNVLHALQIGTTVQDHAYVQQVNTTMESIQYAKIVTILAKPVVSTLLTA